MSKDEQEIFYAEDAQYLDPGSVGSSIHWFVRVHTYGISHGNNKGKRSSTMYASVKLSDCDRHIIWSVDCGEGALKKLDNAISQLRAARKAIVAAKKLHDKHKFVNSDGGEE